MRTVLLASMRVHARRYVAAVVAVVIGVAFVVTTGAVASAARDGMVAGVEAAYSGADVVVSGIDGNQADTLLRAAASSGADAALLGWVGRPASRDGELLAGSVDIGVMPGSPELRWQEVLEGRFPEHRGEAVVDDNAAKSYDVTVGDELQLGDGASAVEATVVGIVDSPSSLVYSSVYLSWPDLRQWAGEVYVDSVAWNGTGSVDDQRSAIAGHVDGALVQPRDEFVQERQAQVTNGVDVLAILLLLFAAIALFVAVLVIANTFSILFAQRRRDLALLRCVGVTRRQLRRSVRLEALVLGAAASALGLLVGTGLGHGLVALARTLAPSATIGDVGLSPGWYVGGFAVGLLATVVAAWLPTRRATAVSPLAALHPQGGLDLRSGAGRFRVALGVGLLAVGVALLALSMASHEPLVMLVGGMACFTGILLLGPVIVPALIRAASPLTAWALGPAGRLAADNAVRDPRRTAATTASLLVGVTLTTAVLTGMASSRQAVDEDLDLSYPVDATLTASKAPLSDAVLDAVADVPDVEEILALRGTVATLADGVGLLPLLAADDVERVAHGSPPLADPGPNEVFVPYELLGERFGGDPIRVTVGDRSERLTIRSGEGWGDAAVVAPDTLDRLSDDSDLRAVWVRAADGADADDLAGDLGAVAVPADAEVSNQLAKRDYVLLQLDIVLIAVLALLGIAVVIALVGIGNTLGLSVLERAREHALLRALGLTRRQLRWMLTAESVLLSLVATVLGTAVGVAFGWVGVHVLVGSLIEEVPVVVPFGQLAVVVVLAAAAGLLACLAPARRATRVAPAAGLSSD